MPDIDIDFADRNEVLGRLKHRVAKLDNGKASVGLEAVKNDHPFYNLVGSDNITVFYTERYKDSPLVVKGAGAGGEFTASGVSCIRTSRTNKKTKTKKHPTVGGRISNHKTSKETLTGFGLGYYL